MKAEDIIGKKFLVFINCISFWNKLYYIKNYLFLINYPSLEPFAEKSLSYVLLKLNPDL